MKYFRSFSALLLWALVSAPAVSAQSFAQEVSIENPKPPAVVGRFLKPFHMEKRIVPPPKLVNTPRLEQLVRGGNLYLSVQDVIALTLENNLDIAVQRYSPFLARENLRRAESGNILRPVDTAVVAGATSVSTTGISTNAAGLVGGAGISTGGGVITQVGPGVPNLDPTLAVQATIGHSTTPQSNIQLTGTTALTNSYRSLFFQYGQSFITGTSVYATIGDSRNFYNSGFYLLNPSLSGYFDIYLTQPLLQGFSRAVNGRDIKVAKNNQKYTDLQVKLQVVTTVSAVLNLYWDLVSFNDAVRIKEQGLKTAQDLYEGNKKQVAIGALAGIEVTRAAAEVSQSKEDLLIAQTNVQQQEIVLKNALNRNSIQNSWLDDVHIIPLDHIEVPKADEVRPVQDLIQEAMEHRDEIEQSKINLESSQIMLKGNKNGLLPSLQGFVDLTSHGLSGDPNAILAPGAGFPNAYFVGGNSNAFAQVFRRNFPDYSAGVSLNIPFRNRTAQADYVTDQLQVRQKELQLQRAINQVRVEVKTNLIGLQQARSRYETAVATRVLAEQTLEAEQKRFQAGVGSVALVIQAQKDLGAAQDGEVQAMANYTHAKIGYDQAIGRTLEVNHISMEEAVSGHVQRESFLPPNVGPVKNPEVRR
ncbi:MAG TPA: TolC family protein [Bryobacteraceae bacterium]|jgi:outer membrane protein TolC